MPLTKGMLLGRKLRKVSVLLFACKKQSESLLIRLMLEILHPVILINLNFSHPWVSLVVSLSYRTVLFSLGMS